MLHAAARKSPSRRRHQGGRKEGRLVESAFLVKRKKAVLQKEGPRVFVPERRNSSSS